MNRKISKRLSVSVILAGAVLGTGWLFLRSSATDGVFYVVEASRLSHWAFRVGQGNPMSMGMEQSIDSHGRMWTKSVTTHYKTVYFGPYMVTRQAKEYSGPSFSFLIDPPQSERALRVPTPEKLKDSLGTSVFDVLERSEHLILFSVEPRESFDTPKKPFHGHEILGQTPITDVKTKAQLLASLYDGLVPASGKSLQYGCFNPRHGIRAEYNGKTADLLLCFSCHQFNTYLNGKPVNSNRFITNAPLPTFNEVLTAANIPIAK